VLANFKFGNLLSGKIERGIGSARPWGIWNRYHFGW
jgi:hypothetical protein